MRCRVESIYVATVELFVHMSTSLKPTLCGSLCKTKSNCVVGRHRKQSSGKGRNVTFSQQSFLHKHIFHSSQIVDVCFFHTFYRCYTQVLLKVSAHPSEQVSVLDATRALNLLWRLTNTAKMKTTTVEWRRCTGRCAACFKGAPAHVLTRGQLFETHLQPLV